ncbi:hypothetical protein PHLH4_41660 [Pseudomonas sp. St316]|nr:hypothetical protein PHLH4_41660 [Pseudomonas sp. St316]
MGFQISNPSVVDAIRRQSIDVLQGRGVIQTYLARTANSSSVLQHNLDKLGVDASIDEMAGKFDSRATTVFAHRDASGEYRLTSGLFISDESDSYGKFRFYSGVGAVKYQTPACNLLVFDAENLRQLKDTYHCVTGVTQFLRELLDRVPCRDLSGYEIQQGRFSYFAPYDASSNGFLIYPNLPYIDFKEYSEEPLVLKERKSGITLGVWALHPNQNLAFAETLGLQRSAWQDNAQKDNCFDNGRTLYEIESGTGVKYLSSILDLDASDVPMLEKLKKDVLDNLSGFYGVEGESDKIKLFFIFLLLKKPRHCICMYGLIRPNIRSIPRDHSNLMRFLKA